MIALISQAAVDLIVEEEVSGKATYEKRYSQPEWPGGASGITIGIGYDVGAGVANAAQLRADWGGKIPDPMIAALVPCIGVTGERAHALLRSVQAVDVPWDAAMAVFETVDVPRWHATCKRALPNFDELSPDCKGALVSLAYNRGASFQNDGDRSREMRAIRQHMVDREFGKIPAEFRSMKRLWVGKGLDGLLARRDREAALFEAGLKVRVVPPPVSLPAPTTPAPSKKKMGLAAVIIAAVGGVTHWIGGHEFVTVAVVIASMLIAIIVLAKTRLT